LKLAVSPLTAISNGKEKSGSEYSQINPFPKKPAEVRMGKGKGAVDHYVAVVRPGRILFEVSNVARDEAQDALRRAAAKLGIKTRFVERVEQV